MLPIGSFPLTNSMGGLLKVLYIKDLLWRSQGYADERSFLNDKLEASYSNLYVHMSNSILRIETCDERPDH